ncbi:MAG: carboxylating nicotinate-nucleotide diphosphorylase, partial [Bacteroidetes bacterium]|nr:carboxylating nicotinate-nucleotide diphosphorylase [Bacteroidota bacterium]
DIAKRIFHRIDASLDLEIFKTDGALVYPDDVVFIVTGEKASILKAERLVLNFMQRLSGIATATNKMVVQIAGLKTQILDTRKTTPLLRELEKYAVKTGGGNNHRMGLYDMIMIKDNHIDFAGGIAKAISAVQHYLKKTGRNLKIEIEVRNFTELTEALEFGQVDRIMLDNFTPVDLAKAVLQIGSRFETEASGGITFETLRSYAETGVDYISVGALTHHIKSLDMSLKAR